MKVWFRIGRYIWSMIFDFVRLVDLIYIEMV
jgi:hypothetical protein